MAPPTSYPVQRFYRKLFTHEDIFNVHKVFGILSLLSYCYRYVWLYPRSGSFHFDGAAIDFLTVFLHSMLPLSSFLFNVPKKRITQHPVMIWEEYRLHAILFSIRSTSVMLFGMMLNGYYLTRIFVILVIHIGIDLVSSKFGDANNTTVRSQKKCNNGATEKLYVRAIKRSFSFFQIMSMASILINSDHIAESAFHFLAAVQISAFFMTLNRKSLITEEVWFIVYSIVVLNGSYHYARVFHWTFILTSMIAFALRCCNVNKYILWATWILLHEVLSITYDDTQESIAIQVSPLPMMFTICFAKYTIHK